MYRFFVLLFLVNCIGCSSSPSTAKYTAAPELNARQSEIKGALISTQFESLEALKEVIQIEYFESVGIGPIDFKKQKVRLSHQSATGHSVVAVLKSGIGEQEIESAWWAGHWEKVKLGLNYPYLGIIGKDMVRVFDLGRRYYVKYGEGDVAFYDLAEMMVANINEEDLALIPVEDLTEKGYINTFNHITAQALMTILFSEKFADFISAVHERGRMPELVSGDFTQEQILDLANGPVDNYVDMINNEWGQELGKNLKAEYQLSRNTRWSPELLARVLNEIQAYYSWTFQIGFHPFNASNPKLIICANKLNKVMQIPSN